MNRARVVSVTTLAVGIFAFSTASAQNRSCPATPSPKAYSVLQDYLQRHPHYGPQDVILGRAKGNELDTERRGMSMLSALGIAAGLTDCDMGFLDHWEKSLTQELNDAYRMLQTGRVLL